MLSAPPRIHLLPEHLIDQIKAGEVIERPGSLIKEILENAIDAGANRLELTLINNGLDLINLKDNGHGILSHELPMAFSRHATSKISRFEDLYHLDSFGFRGEALASIAAISKLQCITFNDSESEGSEIRIEGGLTTYCGQRQKANAQRGTELNIQDLFFNTPARLKFIQSQQSEKNFLKKIIFSFILANPKVEFIIKIDNEEKEVYLAKDCIKDRLVDIMPKTKDQILQSQKSYEDKTVEIFLIPGQIRPPVKFQFTYVNSRFVLDKQLMRVIGNALVNTFDTDDFQVLAFVNLPADHIDVNVHPNKTIIKLFETSKIISLISACIKEMSQKSKGPIHSIPSPSLMPSDVLSPMNLNSLHQERQDYNLEGIFSPHQISKDQSKKMIWIENYILYFIDQNWEAISAPKLLHIYVKEKMKQPAVSIIPLIVSEPYKCRISSHRMNELNELGLELEELSSDTVVLRGIPDWMNGFPLKEIVGQLITNGQLDELQIQSQDWSQSSWDEMIQFLGLSTLREQKVSLHLKSLIGERLK